MSGLLQTKAFDLVKPSELKSLLHGCGMENYRWKGFLRGPPSLLILESAADGTEVVGKIVRSPNEGESKLWPRLLHPNFNPLLDAVALGCRAKVFLAPFVGPSIRDVIQEDSFVQHPLCFARKRRYARGVLAALDYAHERGVFLLNLADWTVRVAPGRDEAVICDFSAATERRRVPRSRVPPGIPFEPPELSEGDFVECVAVDMWACGTLLLQVFSQYLLPWDGTAEDALRALDNQVLRKANRGLGSRAQELKNFLRGFLHQDPGTRCTARQALEAGLFQVRQDEPARDFWRACEECGRATSAVSASQIKSEVSLGLTSFFRSSEDTLDYVTAIELGKSLPSCCSVIQDSFTESVYGHETDIFKDETTCVSENGTYCRFSEASADFGGSESRCSIQEIRKRGPRRFLDHIAKWASPKRSCHTATQTETRPSGKPEYSLTSCGSCATLESDRSFISHERFHEHSAQTSSRKSSQIGSETEIRPGSISSKGFHDHSAKKTFSRKGSQIGSETAIRSGGISTHDYLAKKTFSRRGSQLTSERETRPRSRREDTLTSSCSCTTAESNRGVYGNAYDNAVKEEFSRKRSQPTTNSEVQSRSRKESVLTSNGSWTTVESNQIPNSRRFHGNVGKETFSRKRSQPTTNKEVQSRSRRESTPTSSGSWTTLASNQIPASERFHGSVGKQTFSRKGSQVGSESEMRSGSFASKGFHDHLTAAFNRNGSHFSSKIGTGPRSCIDELVTSSESSAESEIHQSLSRRRLDDKAVKWEVDEKGRLPTTMSSSSGGGTLTIKESRVKLVSNRRRKQGQGQMRWYHRILCFSICKKRKK